MRVYARLAGKTVVAIFTALNSLAFSMASAGMASSLL
jgi:hypothetical protein